MSRELPTPFRIEAAAQSHPGRVRENNEDSFLVLAELGLFAVADGMGGHASGEVASRIAVESLQSFFSNPEVLLPPQPAAQMAFLGAAVRYANVRICRAASGDPETEGMGTTLTVVHAAGTQVLLANVGDSRIYRLRGGHLERLTEDHTVVNEAVRHGLLTPEQAEILPIRHVLTRALGSEDDVQVDLRHEEAQDGDVLLLCSDGLTEMVPETSIARLLGAHEEPRAAAAALIDLANKRGGLDNVTCVVLRFRWTA